MNDKFFSFSQTETTGQAPGFYFSENADKNTGTLLSLRTSTAFVGSRMSPFLFNPSYMVDALVKACRTAPCRKTVTRCSWCTQASVLSKIDQASMGSGRQIKLLPSQKLARPLTQCWTRSAGSKSPLEQIKTVEEEIAKEQVRDARGRPPDSSIGAWSEASADPGHKAHVSELGELTQSMETRIKREKACFSWLTSFFTSLMTCFRADVKLNHVIFPNDFIES